MFEDGANLFKRDAGKPLNELGYLRAIFQVLKQRSKGHTRATKYSRATNAVRIPFNGWTLDQSIIKLIVALAPFGR